MSQPGESRVHALWVATVPVGEADALVHLFSAGDGALRVKARGLLKSQSKLAGLLQPGDELQISLAGHGRVLAGVSVSHPNPHWRAGLDRLALAWYMGECAFVGSATSQLNAPVFQLIANLLRSRPAEAELPGAASVFALKLLALHGQLPDLQYCAVEQCALPSNEPAFLLPSGEGLIGREAYNRSYARSAAELLRVEPARLQRWHALLRGSLLDYGSAGADIEDAAILCGLLTRALANSANQRLESFDFLRRQWCLPSMRDLLTR